MFTVGLQMLGLMVCITGDDVSKDDITTAWGLHNPGLQQAAYELHGHVTITDAFLKGLDVNSKGITDAPMPLRMQCYVDFSQRRLKIQRDEFLWHVPTGKFQRRLSAFVVEDGQATKWEKYPSLNYERVAATKPHRTLLVELLPLWSNHGLMHILMGIPSESLFEAPRDAFKDTVWKTVDDRWLGKRDKRNVVVRFDGNPISMKLLLDDSAGYQIMRCIKKEQGKVLLDVKLTYKTLEGHIIASGWDVSVWSKSGEMERHVALEVMHFFTSSA